VAVRALVMNAAGEPLALIPFASGIIAGPQIVPDSPSVAPADTDIFVSTTLDWTRIYERMLAGAKTTTQREGMAATDEEPNVATGGEEALRKEQSVEATVEAVEKLLGFKIREDLLPSLGNEVSLALPISLLDWTPKFNQPREPKADEAKAGPVILIALNNPDKMRSILPKALALLGIAAAPATTGKTEKYEGFEIQSYGSVAFAFVNNFLVAGENASSIRHVVDAYGSQQTLATRASFRDSGAWQPRQKLAQAYVSETLMKNWLDDYKRRAEDITDPLMLALLTKLDVEPQSATYAATDEGGDALHEVRLPIALIEGYAAGFMFGIKDAPVQSSETITLYNLTRLRNVEEAFKTDTGKGRYATLEELQAAKIIDKNFASGESYKITLSVSGDKYEASATPKDYGKTGRRSFYMDETGIIRAANHKGQPAGADDPPVD
ncbi:MAG: DUF3352 domain-containing protein, partial [Pyrinomonadaceae bacterium]